jgi:hypothetical protein
LQFTVERETDHRINFLDVTIYREKESFSVDIYRKPTATDVIIPNDSCHPGEHKMAAIRYLHNRIISYQLTPYNIRKERDTIMQILSSNKYDKSVLGAMDIKIKHKCIAEKMKWVKFTYIGRETTAITKIFKNTSVKVSFGTDNTIGRHLATKQERNRNKYEIVEYTS